MLLLISLLQNKSDDLEQTPSTLEDLKFVLTTISDIKAMSLEVEDKIRDIQERYRTLSMYDIEVNIVPINFMCAGMVHPTVDTFQGLELPSLAFGKVLASFEARSWFEAFFSYIPSFYSLSLFSLHGRLINMTNIVVRAIEHT